MAERKPVSAIVGIGRTPYYPRGTSNPKTINELIGSAIIAAAQDAGISVKEIDGFATYGRAAAGYYDAMDVPLMMEQLGIAELRFTGTLTGGGGGSAAGIGLAETAIATGQGTYVVTVMGLQQPGKNRLGSIMLDKPPTPDLAFVQPAGMVGPGYMMAVLARRHMHLYGTRREAFAEIAMSQRLNAMAMPTAVLKQPMTLDDYFAAPMIADPLCLYDFCLETDGAVAVISAPADRAKDLKQKPVYVVSSLHGGERGWGRGFAGMQQSDELFATSGHGFVANRLWEASGLKPSDIDVALIYDHFSPMVIMQLEQYGFCKLGEGGAFVESGATRFNGGSIPVNTHGGQLSEGYIVGMTHIYEAVEQLRGTAINQVKDAEFALVTGGPASIPTSGAILRN
jgi:acetyl-CoA acetyltransferase